MEAQAKMQRITSVPNGYGERIFGEGFVITFDVLGQIFRSTVFISDDGPTIKNRNKELAKRLGKEISRLGEEIKRQAIEGKSSTIDFCGIKIKTFGWS